jgi:hypothetical protein
VGAAAARVASVRGYDAGMRRRRPRDSRGREAATRAGLGICLLVITFLPSSCASRSAIPPQGQAQTPPTPSDAVPARPGASATSPPPAAAVPDQPTPSPETRAGRPYRKILELKRSGATDQELLVRIRAENINYQLTSSEILELRGAGVSQEVLEEMLRSGQR